jgi:hypothetical protein
MLVMSITSQANARRHFDLLAIGVGADEICHIKIRYLISASRADSVIGPLFPDQFRTVHAEFGFAFIYQCTANPRDRNSFGHVHDLSGHIRDCDQFSAI